MRIKERLMFLRAGYTKDEINELIAAENEQDFTMEAEEEKQNENDRKIYEDLQKENADLKKQIEAFQIQKISESENEEPNKETSKDVWDSFFGNK